VSGGRDATPALAPHARSRHVVLVGLPGAGKTTIGRRVAQALGRRFIDLDVEIERRSGRRIAAIFAADGEAGFRRLEHEATAALVGAAPAVIAPGGGWATQQASVALLRPRALLVHLAVSPEVALGRLGAGIALRPLLAGADPLAELKRLATERRAAYAGADGEVDTELLDPKEVVDAVLELVSVGRPA
jgi:shikimate kinase